jgi:hypothetical protein
VGLTLVLLAVMAFVNGRRSMVASTLGMDAVPEDRVAVMSMRAAANQFGYLLGAATGGLALALGGFPALGLALAILITQWPYASGCGWPLAGYLGAVAMVLLTGLWIALVSWELRSVAAHVLAFLMLLWGMALVAERVLPRVGYATQRADWSCVEGTTVEALPYGLIGSSGLRDPLAALRLLLVG